MCRYVKAADKEIIAAIKAMGRLVDNQTFTHSYPFCWRSETPLIYRVGSPHARPFWTLLSCKVQPAARSIQCITAVVLLSIVMYALHIWNDEQAALHCF